MARPADLGFVKVFGERGSGTNFLQQLVALNFAAKIVPNITGPTPDQRAAIAAIPDARRRAVQISERIADHNHLSQMPRNGGWKHARLTDRVFERFGRAGHTLFLCILRHPAPWLRSLARKPYHGFSGADEDLDRFLATPWITRARDETDEVILDSPACLWKLKAESYLDQAARRVNVVVLRHEDLLRDHCAVLDGLAALLPGAAAEWSLPDGYARRWMGRTRDFLSIRDELPEDPFDAVSPDQARHLLDRIGPALIARAGYAVPEQGR